MNHSKKGSLNNLTCDVCKIGFNSNADFALHEFSKKHCDNLLRLAKQKPIVIKQKVNKGLQGEKQMPKVNSVAHTGSFSKYGYFVPGQIYANVESSKKFNTDYDPYLQKYAENPFKEKPSIPVPVEATVFCSFTSLKKKKKKKFKTCQVCNATLSTVPEYDAHMKSPEHIWKLKVTGMGVSAHFVKASSNLQTTDNYEESKPCSLTDEQSPDGLSISESSPVGPYRSLYCSDCELLLNSPQQYDAHINGKAHTEHAQKKADFKAKREKLENPSPGQLYCYSCKISLNNLFQYNEHKNGKKHKTKCRNLIGKGITIPPEERVPGIPLLSPKKPIVYPELYEKLVLKNQMQNFCHSNGVLNKNGIESSFSLNCLTEGGFGNLESSRFSKDDELNINYQDDLAMETVESPSGALELPKIIFHKNSTSSRTATPEFNNSFPELLEKNTQDLSITTEKKDSEGQSVLIIDNKSVKCSVCNKIFEWQSKLDTHLGTEDHLKKILYLKQNGTSENEILTMLFSDRRVIKPNVLGKLTCSVCNVTTDRKEEFDQHLSSIVHKYTQKDYKMKRTLEVKHMVGRNEQGVYFCKSCKEGWPSLVEYIQHLHLVKHKSIQRKLRAKILMAKRKMYMQKQRVTQSLRKKKISRRMDDEKNPGVRTKVCGVAVDLNCGSQAPIPNLEPLEPKIDVTKNVTIGVCEKTDDTNCGNNNNQQLKVKKRFKTFKSNRKLKNNDPHPSGWIPSGGTIPPPLIPEIPFHPCFSRPSYAPSCRNHFRAPCSTPYSSVYDIFCGRPPMGNPHYRPLRFQRPGYR